MKKLFKKLKDKFKKSENSENPSKEGPFLKIKKGVSNFFQKIKSKISSLKKSNKDIPPLPNSDDSSLNEVPGPGKVKNKFLNFASKFKEMLKSMRNLRPKKDPEATKIALKEKLKNTAAKVKHKFTSFDIKNLNPKKINWAQFKPANLKERFKSSEGAEGFSFKSINFEKISKVLNLESLYSAIFEVESRKKIHQIFLFSAIVGGMYTLGKATALIIIWGKPMFSSYFLDLSFPPAPKYETMIADVSKENLFKAVRNKKADTDSKRPPVNTKLLCNESNSENNTTLPIKLISTIVLQDEVKSLASVQINNAKHLEYVRKGEELPKADKDWKGVDLNSSSDDKMLRVDKITPLRIFFRNLKSAQCESATNEKLQEENKSSNYTILNPKEGNKIIAKNNVSGIKSDGTNFHICGTYRDKQMGDLSGLLSSAKAAPINNPDGSVAFKISQMRADSLFAKLGVETGDTITRINGNKIKNFNEVLSLMGKIKKVSQLSLTVKRDGEELTMDYNFDNAPDCETKTQN